MNRQTLICLTTFLCISSTVLAGSSHIVGPPSARPSSEELDELNRILALKGKPPLVIPDVPMDFDNPLKSMLPMRPSFSPSHSSETFTTSMTNKDIKQSTTEPSPFAEADSLDTQVPDLMEFDPIKEMSQKDKEKFFKNLGLESLAIREFGTKTLQLNEHSDIHNLDGLNPELPAFAFSSDDTNDVESIDKPVDVISKITSNLIKEKTHMNLKMKDGEFVEYEYVDEDYENVENPANKTSTTTQISTNSSTTSTVVTPSSTTTFSPAKAISSTHSALQTSTNLPFSSTTEATTSQTTTRPFNRITQKYEKLSKFEAGKNYVPVRLVYNKEPSELFRPVATRKPSIYTLPPNVITASAQPVSTKKLLIPVSTPNVLVPEQVKKDKILATVMGLMGKPIDELPKSTTKVQLNSSVVKLVTTTLIPTSTTLSTTVPPTKLGIARQRTYLRSSTVHHHRGLSNQVSGDTSDRVEPRKSSGKMVFRRLFKVRKPEQPVVVVNREVSVVPVSSQKITTVPPPVVLKRRNRHRVYSPLAFSSNNELEFIKAIPPSPGQALAELPSLVGMSSEPTTDESMTSEPYHRIGSQSFLRHGQTVQSIPRTIKLPQTKDLKSVTDEQQKPAVLSPIVTSSTNAQVVRTDDIEAADEIFARSLLQSTTDPVRIVMEGLRQFKKRAKMLRRTMAAKKLRVHGSQTLTNQPKTEKIDNSTDNIQQAESMLSIDAVPVHVEHRLRPNVVSRDV